MCNAIVPLVERAVSEPCAYCVLIMYSVVCRHHPDNNEDHAGARSCQDFHKTRCPPRTNGANVLARTQCQKLFIAAPSSSFSSLSFFLQTILRMYPHPHLAPTPLPVHLLHLDIDKLHEQHHPRCLPDCLLAFAGYLLTSPSPAVHRITL
jgi:hypothetical protein